MNANCVRLCFELQDLYISDLEKLLAAGMLGATVMPHAVYLHSALARDRHGRAGQVREARLQRQPRRRHALTRGRARLHTLARRGD